MALSADSSIIHIVDNTLNHVDPRLMDHARRVACLTYKALRSLDAYGEDELGGLTVLALLHDIGAYKTDEIDNMVQFETCRMWEHSVYGYLFIKYFSPLRELAPVVLFHHADCREATHLCEELRETAQILAMADRFDMLAQAGAGSRAAAGKYFARWRDIRFPGKLIDLFFRQDWEDIFAVTRQDEEFQRILYGRSRSAQEINAFIRMLAASVEFRSPQTVAHTFASTAACDFLAARLPLDPAEGGRLHMACMLHDLGKVGIPVKILEKKDRLEASEMEIMQQHIAITQSILAGHVDDCTLQLAVRHHEKLDGSGYPAGLGQAELTMGQRLVAIADIISALCSARTYKEAFPREKALGILRNMSAEGWIDPDITALVMQCYDELLEAISRETAPLFAAHDAMRREYDELLARVTGFTGDGKGEIRD